MSDDSKVFVEVDADKVILLCALISEVGELADYLFPLAENRLHVGVDIPDNWRRNPGIPMTQWRKQVSKNLTLLGYRDWLREAAAQEIQKG